MNQGLIFNIQKFSIHDGPGIRTTVFFKRLPAQMSLVRQSRIPVNQDPGSLGRHEMPPLFKMCCKLSCGCDQP